MTARRPHGPAAPDGTVPAVGSRIVLLHMPDDPAPLPYGTRGLVESINGPITIGKLTFVQVTVRWDNGSRLLLSVPPDRWAPEPPPIECVGLA